MLNRKEGENNGAMADYRRRNFTPLCEDKAEAALKRQAMQALGRELTESETCTLKWLAGGEFQTIGVIADMLEEMAARAQAGTLQAAEAGQGRQGT